VLIHQGFLFIIIMQKITINPLIIQELLDNSKSIVITTHRSPDGDAIGSSLALWQFLKAKGKNVTVIVPDSFPGFLDWMVGTDDIVYYDKQKELATEIINKCDLLFSLDYNSLSRIGDLSEPVSISKAIKVVIDHHQEPSDFANHYFVDTDCCSTSQLIYEFVELIEELEVFNKAAAECIYCGIMTDTGSFRFPSTTEKTHKIIAHLIELGAENSKIHQNVFDTYSEQRLRLMGYALTEKMKVYNGFSIISFSRKELHDFGYKKGDIEGLVNYPLSIKGIKCAVLVTEKEEGYVSLSFRAKDDFYVNKIAKNNFEGGGHVYAAGGKSDLSLNETIKKVEAILSQEIS